MDERPTIPKMSLQKRITSFRYALNGLSELLKTQANARIHVFATLVVVGAGIYFHISRTEWMALTFCIALVLGLEALNTAIELVVDLVSPGMHPLAGKAKDVAAAAVLIAAMGALVVGGIIFLPKILPAWSL